MYRQDSYQRVFWRINYLKRKQSRTCDLATRLELNGRIQNLKNILALISRDDLEKQ